MIIFNRTFVRRKIASGIYRYQADRQIPLGGEYGQRRKDDRQQRYEQGREDEALDAALTQIEKAYGKDL